MASIESDDIQSYESLVIQWTAEAVVDRTKPSLDLNLTKTY